MLTEINKVQLFQFLEKNYGYYEKYDFFEIIT